MTKWLAFFILLFAVHVNAQDMSCDSQHIGSLDYTVCRFSDGRVSVQYLSPTDYSEYWFTRTQFAAWKAKQNAKRPANHKSEAQAQSWHTQQYCEADGFVWKDNGCHAR